MTDPIHHEPRRVSTFRRLAAGILDFLTLFLGAGYLIALVTGGLTEGGFSLGTGPSLVLLALIVLYFYLGWKKLGGTIWQRILGVPVQ